MDLLVALVAGSVSSQNRWPATVVGTSEPASTSEDSRGAGRSPGPGRRGSAHAALTRTRVFGSVGTDTLGIAFWMTGTILSVTGLARCAASLRVLQGVDGSHDEHRGQHRARNQSGESHNCMLTPFEFLDALFWLVGRPRDRADVPAGEMPSSRATRRHSRSPRPMASKSPRTKRHRCAVVTRFFRGTVIHGHTCAVVSGRRSGQLRSIDASPEVVTSDTFPGTGTAVIDHFVGGREVTRSDCHDPLRSLLNHRTGKAATRCHDQSLPVVASDRPTTPGTEPSGRRRGLGRAFRSVATATEAAGRPVVAVVGPPAAGRPAVA